MGETATIAVLFCDLVSSTERLTRLGDDAADEFRRRFFTALRTAVQRTGGQEIKSLGDGLMVAFEHSTIGALSCASMMHESVCAIDTDDPVQLRIGISVGEVGHEEDDWFGTPVVEAARLCAAAAPGQTLATAVVRALVGSRGGRQQFVELGTMRLKGLAEPVPVVAVESVGPVELPSDLADPVPPSRPTGEIVASGPRRPRARHVYLASGVVLVVAVVLLGVLWAQRDSTDGAAGDAQLGTAGTAGSGPQPQGYTPRYKTVDCTQSIRSDTPDATCGELIVPEVRSAPHKRSIHVDVVHVPALTKTAAPPTLLVDVNEPLATSPLREVADVYDVTLRGFSPSDKPRLVCPQLRDAWQQSLSLGADDPHAIDQRVAAAGDCAKALTGAGVQLQGYSMYEVADDLRDLAIALRLPHVAVAASAFSTTAAVRFAREHNGVVTSLLLTNPTPPGESTLANPTLDLSKTFGRVAGLCATQPACAAKFPNLEASFTERVAAYDASPQLVTTKPLNGDPAMRILLDGRRLAAALSAALMATGQVPLVPSALTPGGVPPDLLAAAAINQDVNYYAGGGAIGGAVLSFFCSYDAMPNRTGGVSDAALRAFSGANDPTFQPMCDAWGVPSVFTALSLPLPVNIPVLFVEGGLSDAGVNEWSKEMAAPLDRAPIVELPTLSEDVSYIQPACVREIRKRFLVDPKADLKIKACEDATPPIEFIGT